jgi:hypothetical protein
VLWGVLDMGNIDLTALEIFRIPVLPGAFMKSAPTRAA